MASDLDDAEYEISNLKREIDELRDNLAKAVRRLDNTEPKANRTDSFAWDRMRNDEQDRCKMGNANSVPWREEKRGEPLASAPLRGGETI